MVTESPKNLFLHEELYLDSLFGVLNLQTGVLSLFETSLDSYDRGGSVLLWFIKSVSAGVPPTRQRFLFSIWTVLSLVRFVFEYTTSS